MTDRYETRASTHADDCWSWGPAHYECAVREIERLRKMHQDAYQRGLQAGSRGLREMYDAIQEVKHQDAWDNTRLTEALMAAEEQAERVEAENKRLLEERDAILEALEKARAFIGEQPVRTETVGKSVYLRELLAKVMRVMSTIDAALEAASSHKSRN